MRSSMKTALYRDVSATIFSLQKYIYHHLTKQSSMFQNDPSSNCFTVDVCIICISLYTSACFGNTCMFVIGAILKDIICTSVWGWKQITYNIFKSYLEHMRCISTNPPHIRKSALYQPLLIMYLLLQVLI